METRNILLRKSYSGERVCKRTGGCWQDFGALESKRRNAADCYPGSGKAGNQPNFCIPMKGPVKLTSIYAPQTTNGREDDTFFIPEMKPPQIASNAFLYLNAYQFCPDCGSRN